MSQFNPKVDAYIAKSEDFAKQILNHLRKLLHDTCPDVTEEIKWGFPHFDYKGEIMCILAAYKNHCSFSFWKSDLMQEAKLKANSQLKADKRYMGKLTALSDLPSDEILIAYIKEAMVLNETGAKVERPKSDKPAAPIEAHPEFLAKLSANPSAKEIFETKSASFRKDYNIWIADAKTDATRNKRIEESIEWIAEGKGRFWKYEK